MNIGIAASIGGLKPVAVVGLIKALEDRGLRDNIVAYSASSGGTPWCALAAAGGTGDQLWEDALSIDSKSVYEDWVYGSVLTSIWRSITRKKIGAGFTGLMAGNRFREWMYKHIERYTNNRFATFEDLPTPLYITAFDINEARGCLFGPYITASQVEVVKAVRGSSAIPGGFRHETFAIAPPPEPMHGFWDGGVVACLPIMPLLELADPKPDIILALDATGATSMGGRKWISIDKLGTLDFIESMVTALVDEANHLQLDYVKSSGIPLHVMDVSVSASMADPGGTIPAALEASYIDANKFLNEVFG